MNYLSTRGSSPALRFSQALSQGLAPDGGLYVPEIFPKINIGNFHAQMEMAELGALLLAPFLTGDTLQSSLPAICKAALNFPLPLRFRSDGTAILELFHGPTAAFKDVGARFLAECVSRDSSPAPKRTVVVATSGDTGGAVAGAFFGKPNLEVFVLFPKGKVSQRQEKQIACWGGNVKAFAVQGTFDDCQKIVKQALSDSSWREQRSFLSANSISIGRLLPQMIYYAKSSLEYRQACGVNPGVIVPTGNLGNAVAALWAKRLGFPIAKIVLATNANRAISDFFSSGQWQPHDTIATLANAMDVGDPSNMERLRSLYPDLKELQKDVATFSVKDEQIQRQIRQEFQRHHEVFCPHTATALSAREHFGGTDWIVVATAHPAKFETIVEPLIGDKIEVPSALARLLNQPAVFTELPASYEAFKTLAK